MSITIRTHRCVNCGAPLEGLTCHYCDSTFEPPETLTNPVPRERPELIPEGLFELEVGDSRFRVLGQLGRGENSQVLLARRAVAVTEQVILKVFFHSDSSDNEWSAIHHLHGRCDYLDRLLPLPVVRGVVRGRTVHAYRWRSGFVRDLNWVRKRLRGKLDPAHTVWMWNRILDQLDRLKQLGDSHGDLKLEHLLVHPRDHGIAFCGWGKARLGPQNDLEMSARCIASLLGKRAPKPLLELTQSAHQFEGPAQLKRELQKVARATFGPPRFIPFALPGA